MASPLMHNIRRSDYFEVARRLRDAFGVGTHSAEGADLVQLLPRDLRPHGRVVSVSLDEGELDVVSVGANGTVARATLRVEA